MQIPQLPIPFIGENDGSVSETCVKFASGTDRELTKDVQFLNEEIKMVRSRIPGEIHTKSEERQRLFKIGKSLGRAIDEGRPTTVNIKVRKPKID